METYTVPKQLVDNPHYQEQRHRSLGQLNDNIIDKPIVQTINGFNRLPYCFTLQSCYGHFVHDRQKDPHNLEPLPVTSDINRVEYRIAYIGFCIENSNSGRVLLDDLEGIRSINPDNIQFCCAEWFWKRQVNSYALQVEPDRFKDKDKAFFEYREALYIEEIRNEFFFRLHELTQKHLARNPSVQ